MSDEAQHDLAMDHAIVFDAHMQVASHVIDGVHALELVLPVVASLIAEVARMRKRIEDLEAVQQG